MDAFFFQSSIYCFNMIVFKTFLIYLFYSTFTFMLPPPGPRSSAASLERYTLFQLGRESWEAGCWFQAKQCCDRAKAEYAGRMEKLHTEQSPTRTFPKHRGGQKAENRIDYYTIEAGSSLKSHDNNTVQKVRASVYWALTMVPGTALHWLLATTLWGAISISVLWIRKQRARGIQYRVQDCAISTWQRELWSRQSGSRDPLRSPWAVLTCNDNPRASFST